jgi:hypothetical protein
MLMRFFVVSCAAKEGDRRHVSDRKRRVVAVRIDRSNTVDVLKVALSNK